MLIAKPPKSFETDTVVSLVNKRAPGTLGNAGTGAHETELTYNCIVQRDGSYARGYNLSDYRDLLAKGKLIPMTPWDGYRGTFRVISGVHDVYMHFVYPYYRYWSEGSPYTWQVNIPQPWWSGHNDLKTILETQDASYFVQAVAAKIYSSGWDALTFAAELSKTTAMFRDFVSRLITLARKGRLESLWLEGRYGWRTLWYDMKDIEKAILNLNEGRKRYRDKVGTTVSDTSIRTDPFTTVYGTLTCTTTYTDLIGLRGSIVADIEPPRFQFNPLTTSWELLKLSFVIDWVINFGQFLEALSFLAVKREYTAAQGLSVKRTFTQTSSVSFATGCSGTWHTSSEGTATLVRRIPASVSTIPLPRIRLDSYKVADLVALLIQSLFRNKK